MVIDLEETAHGILMQEARQRNMTLANYVRKALQLPLGRQGVRTDSAEIVRPTIEDVAGFYLTEGNASFQVWLPAGDCNTPFLVTPTPRLVKAAYVSAAEVRFGHLQHGQSVLRGQYPLLLLDVPHSYGPPLRAVRIFTRDAGPVGPPNAATYLATTSRAPYTWFEDLNWGKPGYLLTGLPNASDLWQIISREPDPADRCTFTLSPVRLPHGLPTPDFTKISDPTLSDEAKQHWSNLEQAVIAHNAYGIVNSAASLSEALLQAFLSTKHPHRSNLSELLDSLRKELDKGQSAFSPLSYHIMQSVRVMHQSTQHPRSRREHRALNSARPRADHRGRHDRCSDLNRTGSVTRTVLEQRGLSASSDNDVIRLE